MCKKMLEIKLILKTLKILSPNLTSFFQQLKHPTMETLSKSQMTQLFKQI